MIQQLRQNAGRATAFVILFLAVASGAASYGQSCALCYTQAAGSGRRFIQGLRTGILVLIVPPMFMSVGITWLAYRKRNRYNDPSVSQKRDEW